MPEVASAAKYHGRALVREDVLVPAPHLAAFITAPGLSRQHKPSPEVYPDWFSGWLCVTAGSTVPTLDLEGLSWDASGSAQS
jgi:hypothetical protein